MRSSLEGSAVSPPACPFPSCCLPWGCLCPEEHCEEGLRAAGLFLTLLQLLRDAGHSLTKGTRSPPLWPPAGQWGEGGGRIKTQILNCNGRNHKATTQETFIGCS